MSDVAFNVIIIKNARVAEFVVAMDSGRISTTTTKNFDGEK